MMTSGGRAVEEDELMEEEVGILSRLDASRMSGLGGGERESDPEGVRGARVVERSWMWSSGSRWKEEWKDELKVDESWKRG